jgi:hypothetical protein
MEWLKEIPPWQYVFYVLGGALVALAAVPTLPPALQTAASIAAIAFWTSAALGTSWHFYQKAFERPSADKGEVGPGAGNRPSAKLYEAPIWEAVSHVGKVLGDQDTIDFFPRARNVIRQAALDGDLLIRGRKELEGRPGRCDTIHSDIQSAYWATFQLNILSGAQDAVEHYHTVHLNTPHQTPRYWDLRVNWQDILALWPTSPVVGTQEAERSIKWTFNRIAKLRGLNPSSDDTSPIWGELRQAARDGRVTVRGRPESGHLRLGQFSKPIEDIPCNHWRDYGFYELGCLVGDDETAFCRTEPDRGKDLSGCYADLRVSQAQVAQLWPNVVTTGIIHPNASDGARSLPLSNPQTTPSAEGRTKSASHYPPEAADFDAWDRRSIFTLRQAAQLWAGERPGPADLSQKAQIILTELIAAGHEKRLHIEPIPQPKNDLERLMNIVPAIEAAYGVTVFHHSRATRDSLRAYALTIKECPPFLFPEMRA